ncbi:MAG: M24 family metallopeptidase [Actinobacteria bacterium]|nr:M24 family metallopeptidase [Actinomycetota bacterium]
MEFLKGIATVDLTKKIPKIEHEDRLKRLRKALAEKDIDVGIAYGTHCMPGDVQYLCGYDPQIENVAMVISQDNTFVLGGPEGQGYAEEMMEVGEWKNLKEFQIPLEDYPGVDWQSLKDLIKEACPITRRISILTSNDVITHGFYQQILDAKPDKAELIETPEILAEMRYIKSKNEQDLIKLANITATESMRLMVENIKEGVRELEISAIADYVTKTMGCYAGGVELDNIVMSGDRLDTIIGRATNKKFKNGEMVVLGVISRYEGYSSILGRTVVVGGANKEQSDFIEHGITAFNLASEKLVYGMPAKGIEIAARTYLNQFGMSNFYSCGHGGGITECLEGKPATQFTTYLIPKNIVMMIDIGVFKTKKGFGLRHEDEFIVTDKGETIRITDYPIRVYK